MTHVMLIPAMYIPYHTSNVHTSSYQHHHLKHQGVLLHPQLGCYTIYHPAFTQLLGCYTCTPSTGVCCYTAKGLLHMFTWHRCQPCTANTSPIERGFSDNSLRAHFAAVSPKLLRDCSPAFLDACHPGGWVSEETRKPTGQRRNCILIHSV